MPYGVQKSDYESRNEKIKFPLPPTVTLWNYDDETYQRDVKDIKDDEVPVAVMLDPYWHLRNLPEKQRTYDDAVRNEESRRNMRFQALAIQQYFKPKLSEHLELLYAIESKIDRKEFRNASHTCDAITHYCTRVRDRLEKAASSHSAYEKAIKEEDHFNRDDLYSDEPPNGTRKEYIEYLMKFRDKYAVCEAHVYVKELFSSLSAVTASQYTSYGGEGPILILNPLPPDMDKWFGQYVRDNSPVRRNHDADECIYNGDIIDRLHSHIIPFTHIDEDWGDEDEEPTPTTQAMPLHPFDRFRPNKPRPVKPPKLDKGKDEKDKPRKPRRGEIFDPDQPTSNEEQEQPPRPPAPPIKRKGMTDEEWKRAQTAYRQELEDYLKKLEFDSGSDDEHKQPATPDNDAPTSQIGMDDSVLRHLLERAKDEIAAHRASPTEKKENLSHLIRLKDYSGTPTTLTRNGLQTEDVVIKYCNSSKSERYLLTFGGEDRRPIFNKVVYYNWNRRS